MWPFRRDTIRERRSWKRRGLITFNVVLATLLVLGAGGVGYAKFQFGKVDKLDLGGILNRDGGSKNPMTVLLVGSDSREDLAPGEAKKFGGTKLVTGKRSDTIMLLRVDPKTQRAAILSVPRDLYVPIAGTSERDRINTAFLTGGAERLIQTIQQTLGISVDHYAQVDFDGFKGIVDAIDGVTIRFDAPARDPMAGLSVPKAGCIKLSGDQALAYVRSRNYEAYEGGRWRRDPRSDFSRIDRQQDFIRRVIRKAVDKATGNPLTLNSLVSSGVKNLTVDEGFSLNDMTRLARRFQSLDPNKVQMMTLPTTAAKIGGADVLRPKPTEDKQTVDLFLNGPPEAQGADMPAIPPGSLSVRVLNGSGTPGQATEVAGNLKDAGFVVAGIGDGRSTDKTMIRYAPGGKAKAEVIAKFIKGPTQLTEDRATNGVDAIITTGDSFEGINVPGSEASVPPPTTPAPSTTAKPSPFVPANNAGC